LTKTQFEDDPRQVFYTNYSTPPYTGVAVPNYDDENAELHFGGGLSLQWIPSDILEFNLPFSYTGKFIKMDMASWSSHTDRTMNAFEARPQAIANLAFSDMSLRILGGVDVYYTRLNVDEYSEPEHTNKNNTYDISEWTVGPYLTARFSPLSNLFISAGARFDTATIKAENPFDPLAEGDKTHTAFVYDAGITFNPLPELKVYARYASLFRYPFIDEQVEQPVFGGPGKFNSDLDPEKGFNVEGGASYRFGNIAAVNANFFFMRLEDEIAYEGGGNVNLDETQRIGANIGLALTPIDLISVDVAYSFVDATFINGVNKGKYIPMVPVHTLSASLAINLPFGLSFGPNFDFSGEQFQGGDTANALTDEKVGSIFLVGARIRYVFESNGRNLALQITGRNLADIRYAPYIYYSAYYPADGRSLNVSLQYRF
jgi:iron complex outermembrane receptor protein